MHGKFYQIDKLISELGNVEKQLEEVCKNFESYPKLKMIFLFVLITVVIVAISIAIWRFISFLNSKNNLRKQKIQIIERQLNLVGPNGKNYDVLVSILSEI